MLPSPVFWFDGDHRFRPSRLPTTDACQEELSAGWSRWSGFPTWAQRGRGTILTRASPTPNAKSPVKWSNCDGLGKGTSAKPGTPPPDAALRPRFILVDVPLKPHRVGTPSKQIKVTQDRRPSVLIVQELVHEEMY